MPIRVVVHEDRPLKQALAILREQIRRQTIDDRIRRRRWGTEHYEKPGYVRRQEKFFAKVKAKHDEQFHRITGGQYRELFRDSTR
ncbi:MAG: 30S ribosomal protein S21 [Planctomycetes bacterium]|nr:30S ribosomal protein S21 [Planctomycetota bacterium]